MTPTLRHGVNETEVEARIRLGRPRTGEPATEDQVRAGAALNGVYHPPQPPYKGYTEDALFQVGDPPPRRVPWGLREKLVLALAVLVAVFAVAGIFRGL